MKNKIILLAAISALMLSACTSVRFDRYPGTALDTIPSILRGQYTSILGTDTVTIYVGKKSFTQINKEETKIEFLGDKTIFSDYKNNYFISTKDSVYWVTAMVMANGKDLAIKPIVTENSKKARATLKKYFKEVTYLSGNQYATKMNEVALLKFGKKNVKNALQLKRVE